MAMRAAWAHRSARPSCGSTGAGRWRFAVLAMACLLPWVEGGCFLFPRAKPVPPTLVLTQPIILSTPDVTATPPPPAPPAPPNVIVLAPESAPKLSPPARHRRRHVAASRKPVEAANPAAADAGPQPQLTSELTPEEAARYRRTTAEWLDAAIHDLKLTANRQLAAEEAATRAQANEYISQAQAALAEGAVVRAQNLAHKALVLAEALLGG